MTDQLIDLPAPESLATEVSIPAALAAPKQKRGKKSLATESRVETPVVEAVAPAPLPEEPVFIPIAAAAPAAPTEEPIMATTIENIAQTATEKTPSEKNGAHFADLNDRAKDAMEKSTKLFAELNGFAKGNVEALVESSKLAVAGFQSMAQDQAAYVRKQFEEATAAARTMSTVKSPTELVKLQGDFARQHFDGMVAEASRSTETMLKLVGEVVQPISNRVAVAVEKIKLAA